MQNLHHTIVLLVAVALAAACQFRSEPELALDAYVHAVNEGRCDNARELLSTRSRYGLDVLRVKPQHRQSPLPVEEYFCTKLYFEDCKWGKMKLDEQTGDTARVSMPCGRTQDSIFPGFSSPFLKYEPRVTELVREDGEWHIVLPTVIRIVEIRDREDQMREDALRRQEEMRRESGLPPAPPRTTATLAQ